MPVMTVSSTLARCRGGSPRFRRRPPSRADHGRAARSPRSPGLGAHGAIADFRRPRPLRSLRWLILGAPVMLPRLPAARTRCWVGTVTWRRRSPCLVHHPAISPPRSGAPPRPARSALARPPGGPRSSATQPSRAAARRGAAPPAPRGSGLARSPTGSRVLGGAARHPAIWRASAADSGLSRSPPRAPHPHPDRSARSPDDGSPVPPR